jgi:hypothetical protein
VVGSRCEFSWSVTPQGSYRGGDLTILSVTYGDLIGDGQEDAAVDALFSTGGTLNWHYVYVFTLRNGLPTLLGRLQSGTRADGGLLKVTISEGMLVLDFVATRRRIADCCSKGYARPLSLAGWPFRRKWKARVPRQWQMNCERSEPSKRRAAILDARACLASVARPRLRVLHFRGACKIRQPLACARGSLFPR